jgi:dihydrodiol dehydrogenase / D-xylose 1-dehydrogenase (NADP)
MNWGILGTGKIAHKFAGDMQFAAGSRIVAVGSRSTGNAANFAKRFSVPHMHGSYEDLVNDADVQIVYVATPHPFHRSNMLLCLEAGKHVLCEKPFTINAGEAEEVIGYARRKGLFLMEGMWTRFIPVYSRVRTWLRGGRIGEPRMVTADFGYRVDVDPASRIFDPALGGGALLDVGVYTVALSSFVFGREPARVSGLASIGTTGVDEQNSVVLGYDRGELAILISAVRTDTPKEARIVGTEGTIYIAAPFWKSTSATLMLQDKSITAEERYQGTGMQYEIDEVSACVRAGKTESERMPPHETLGIMKTMDAIRKQWGLKYPGES